MAHSSVIITTACTSHGDVMELTIVKISPTKRAVPVSFMMRYKLRRYFTYMKDNDLLF